jgi:DNA repair protein RecO (recombination protein O)
MNQLTTTGIILQCTEYGEADRILVLLTPDYGKLHLMAKGVRKVKSKLAGGIELFSVSNVTYIKGRSDLGTLVSARLLTYYANIVKDINRTMLGYELIKQLNKATEDQPEPEYFELLKQAFIALDDPAVALPIVQLWFQAQLLQLAGHTPNLRTDTSGAKLAADQTYNFSPDDMAFASGSSSNGNSAGRFSADHIKFLRLAFGSHPARLLQQVQGSENLTKTLAPLLATMAQTYLRS